MKSLMTPTFRVWMALVGFVTLAACDPICDCASTVDCYGDIDDVVRECDLGAVCEADDKGNVGRCVEVFPDYPDDTTTQ